MDGHTMEGEKKFQSNPNRSPIGVSGPTSGLYRLIHTIAATTPGIMYGTSSTIRKRFAAFDVSASRNSARTRLTKSMNGIWTQANSTTRRMEPMNAESVSPSPNWTAMFTELR